ncbi:MAG: hypothetical protein HOQ24_01510 [Mycobacteriaceae bacterium]|nr:hypothetical protein [Streptomycetaceae bacterium]NUS42362.1 hypothetical protein [Mycobacteriaceae bacterium]
MDIAITVGIVVTGLLGLVAVALWGMGDEGRRRPRRDRERRQAGERQRVERTLRDEMLRAGELWEVLDESCHDVPQPLTVETAHYLLRAHLEHPTDRCPCRGAALEVLRQAGRYVLAQRASPPPAREGGQF